MIVLFVSFWGGGGFFLSLCVCVCVCVCVWQPSQSLILGPTYNKFGATDTPIFGFWAQEHLMRSKSFPFDQKSDALPTELSRAALHRIFHLCVHHTIFHNSQSQLKITSFHNSIDHIVFFFRLNDSSETN